MFYMRRQLARGSHEKRSSFLTNINASPLHSINLLVSGGIPRLERRRRLRMILSVSRTLELRFSCAVDWTIADN